ncbi:hypothetical protein, partial [Corynebacterium glyciniphilum]|uniref:hypothetical protein n=1 Tax=Corynebacterium glyciniphilum TaxID=1404244 RepID=UPI001C92ECEA
MEGEGVGGGREMVVGGKGVGVGDEWEEDVVGGDVVVGEVEWVGEGGKGVGRGEEVMLVEGEVEGVEELL